MKTFNNQQVESDFLLIPKQKNYDKINSNRRILIVDDEPYNLLGLKIVI